MDQTGIDTKELTEYRDCVPEGAFRDRRDLVSFEIPEGTRTIGPYAFCGCSSLREVRIPEGVREIGARAFEGCLSLGEIHFPSTLEKAGRAPSAAVPPLRRPIFPML
ncbi:MAG: leucine-rich repeat domain-containing protein [Eubacteriaceae bacterium]|nr:leucine-rich repeat domain-containing protein [Eubacteriaceae bacterium]